jgi:hypothetical protein
MQTLGIAESTPSTESRLKSLFWPSIGSAFDVEYLAVQGYWVCFLVAALSFAFLVAVSRQPVVGLIGLIVFLFLYLGGIGVREHDRFAATIVFVYYVIDGLASYRSFLVSPGGTVIRVVIVALLFSNLRATWIAAKWQRDSEEAAIPERLGETWSDKFANKWPAWIWPKVRVVYYIFAVVVCLLLAFGLVAMLLGRARG